MTIWVYGGNKHTGVAILKIGSILVISGVDDGQDALVQVVGLTEGLQVIRSGEVAVGALNTLVATTAALKPALVLSFVCGGSVIDGINGNILIAANGSLNLGSVGKSLRLSSGRVQSLQEAHG